MADDQSFKISLNGPGITLERPVSEEVAQQIVLLVLGGAAPQRFESDARVQSAAPLSGHTPSLREFVDAHEPREIQRRSR